MKLWKWNFGGEGGATGAEPVAEKKSYDGAAAAWVRGEEYDSGRMVNALTQVVWVYRCVATLADQVAGIAFRFAGRGTRGRVDTSALERFYEAPNRQLNGFQYWETKVMWLMLRGECFRLPIWSENRVGGKLQEVVFLDPDRMEHVVIDGALAGWRYRSGGKEDVASSQTFLPEEVWYDRLVNPFNPWRGLSPLQVAATATKSDYAASQYMKALMENNGDAGMVVRSEDYLDDAQREQILGVLRERKAGIGRADRPILLWGGMEVSSPKAAAADLQLLAHRRFTMAEICAAFGVPEEMVASLNAAKYDMMKGARLNFVENRVVPLCRRLEAEEQVVVRSINPEARGFFLVDEHPVMAQARRERLASAREGWEMGVPLNELNRTMDLGFKEFAWGNVGYVPRGMGRADGEGS